MRGHQGVAPAGWVDDERLSSSSGAGGVEGVNGRVGGHRGVGEWRGCGHNSVREQRIRLERERERERERESKTGTQYTSVYMCVGVYRIHTLEGGTL